MDKPRIFTPLKPCPCCRGKAELSDMMVGNIVMWQVHCARCGLSSELDDDSEFSVQNWNRRLETEKLTRWLTLAASSMPFIAILAFLAGGYMGFSLFS